MLPPDLSQAYDTLMAKHMLAHILQSKSHSICNLSPGDFIDLYVKRNGEKRGTGSSPRTILSVDRAS